MYRGMSDLDEETAACAAELHRIAAYAMSHSAASRAAQWCGEADWVRRRWHLSADPTMTVQLGAPHSDAQSTLLHARPSRLADTRT